MPRWCTPFAPLDLGVSYQRGVEYIAVLREPVFRDVARLEMTGLLGRRVDVSASAGYFVGQSALSMNSEHFDTYTGTARARYSVSRSLAVYAEYLLLLLQSARAGSAGARPPRRVRTAWYPAGADAVGPAGRSLIGKDHARAHLQPRRHRSGLDPAAVARSSSRLRWAWRPRRFWPALRPTKYRSETLIMVVPQRVPDSYVKATITESIEDRLPSISEQILSRSRLERIITDMDLYKDRPCATGDGGRGPGRCGQT